MEKTARENVPSQQTDTDVRSPKTPTDPVHGTGIMPMPDDAPEVAGRPRQGRVITPPGEPGVITPEDDVLDTSQSDKQDR